MTSPIPYYTPAAPSIDEEHLRLLSIIHYVLAGLTVLGGCFPGMYLAFGIGLLTGTFPPGARSDPASHFLGVVLVCVGASLMLGIWTLALLMFLVARHLTRRRHLTFCFVVACLECLFIPLGTILGIFSIIVLSRSSVKHRFDLPLSPTP